jgi:topoisomerase IA-like protein
LSDAQQIAICSTKPTISAKIRMGYAVGLFGEETKNNVDIIRIMRNVFAHAPSPVKFSTVEIEDACALLKVPARVGAADDQKVTNTTGRERFRLVCERTGAALRYVPTVDGS